jgi:hypothetical protein
MKREITIIALLVLLVSLLAVGVSAQDDDGLDIIGSIKGSTQLKYLFVDLPTELNNENPSDESLIVAKVIFGILIFAILFAVSNLGSIGQFSKNARVSIAALVSLIAAVTIPTSMLLTVIKLYGGSMLLFFVGVIVVVLFFAIFKWIKGEDRASYFTKFALTGLMLFTLQQAVNIVDGLDIPYVGTAIGLLRWIFVFLLFYYIIVGVFLDKGKETAKKVSGALDKEHQLPSAVSRPLRQLGRAAYRMETMTKREIEQITNTGSELETVEREIGECVSKTPALPQKQRKANALEKSVDRLKSEVDGVRKMFDGRGESWATDVSVRAKRLGDPRLLHESEGMIAEVESIKKRLGDAGLELAAVQASLGGVATAADGTAANKLFRSADSEVQNARRELSKVKEYMDDLKRLELDVVTRAGTS